MLLTGLYCCSGVCDSGCDWVLPSFAGRVGRGLAPAGAGMACNTIARILRWADCKPENIPICIIYHSTSYKVQSSSNDEQVAHLDQQNIFIVSPEH